MSGKNRLKITAAASVFLLCGCSSDKIETAAMNTFMGIGTVFSILALISILIYCFKIIPFLTEKYLEKNRPAPPKPEDFMDKRIMTPEPKRLSEPKEDERDLIAVIAAAIAQESGMDPNAFVVRRIRRIK